MEQHDKKTNILPGLKAIARHLKPYRREFFLITVLGLVLSVVNGFLPYIVGQFFDALINLAQGGEISGFPRWAILLLAWGVVQAAANIIELALSRKRRSIDTKVHLGIQTFGFIHLFRLPLSFHKSARINEILQRLSTAGWRVSAIIRTVIDIAPQLLSIIIGLVFAASINVVLAGVLAVGVIIYVLLLIRILIPVARLDDEAHRAWNNGWNDAAAAVHQVESVKQAAAENYETEKTTAALLGKAYTLWYKIERIWSNINFSSTPASPPMWKINKCVRLKTRSQNCAPLPNRKI